MSTYPRPTSLKHDASLRLGLYRLCDVPPGVVRRMYYGTRGRSVEETWRLALVDTETVVQRDSHYGNSSDTEFAVIVSDAELDRVCGRVRAQALVSPTRPQPLHRNESLRMALYRVIDLPAGIMRGFYDGPDKSPDVKYRDVGRKEHRVGDGSSSDQCVVDDAEMERFYGPSALFSRDGVSLYHCRDVPVGTVYVQRFNSLESSQYTHEEAVRASLQYADRKERFVVDLTLHCSTERCTVRDSDWTPGPVRDADKQRQEEAKIALEAQRRRDVESVHLLSLTNKQRAADDPRKQPDLVGPQPAERAAWSARLRELQADARHRERYSVVCEPVWALHDD